MRCSLPMVFLGMGLLEVCQISGAIGLQGPEVDLLIFLRYNRQGNHFSQSIVRISECSAFLHLRQSSNHHINIMRIDVNRAGDNQFLFAACEVKISIFIQIAQIAGPEIIPEHSRIHHSFLFGISFALKF